MERFGVTPTQGHCSDIFRINRLPAYRYLWLLRVVCSMRRWEVRAQNRRSVLAEPLLALGKVNFETIEAGEVPRGTGEGHPHFFVNTPNIPVHPRAFTIG